MRITRTGLIVMALCCWLTTPVWANYPFEMWEGQRQAKNGTWAQALAHFEKALAEKPDSAEAHYNLGICHYRQGDYAKASEFFKKAQELGGETKLRGRSSYNLGNSLYREKKLEDALAAYKVALRWNELDDDARYNIQVILDQLKKNKDKNNDKNKNNDKDKSKDKDKKDQDKKDKDKKDKSKDNKDDKKDKDKGKNPKGQDKDQGQKDKDKSKPKPDDQQPPSDPNQMSKQDAERLLQYFQNREKKNAEDRNKKGRPVRTSVGEDW